MDWGEFIPAMLLMLSFGWLLEAAGLSMHEATTYAVLVIVLVRVFKKRGCDE